MKKVKISDIARETGYSISTVSKALGEGKDISVKTREEILLVAIKLGYEIGNKRVTSNEKVAIVIKDLNPSPTSFEYQMVFGFKLMATRNNYEVDIVECNPIGDDWDFRKEIIDKGYKGAFVLRTKIGTEMYRNLRECEFPIVVFDDEIDMPNCAYIGCDNELGMRLAVDHLVKLGHDKIAFFGGSATAYVSKKRKKGFVEAMNINNKTVYPELITETSFSRNEARHIIPDYIKAGVTAIVCSSDLLASCVIEELKNQNRRVPEDISVIGYDNVALAEDMQLTTVAQNTEEIGRNAFYVLESLIRNSSLEKIVLKPKLIIRNSTKQR